MGFADKQFRHKSDVLYDRHKNHLGTAGSHRKTTPLAMNP